MKACSSCGEAKPACDFYRRKASKDGLAPICKACDSARRRAYYAKHREDELARNKRYADNNKDSVRNQRAEYRKRNADRERARNKAWYEANKARASANYRRWKERNAERYESTRKAYAESHRKEAIDRAMFHHIKNRPRSLALKRRARERKCFDVTLDEKRCSTCGETRAASEFHRDKSKRGGLSSRCRSCVAAYIKEWKRRNTTRAGAIETWNDMRKRQEEWERRRRS